MRRAATSLWACNRTGRHAIHSFNPTIPFRAVTTNSHTLQQLLPVWVNGWTTLRDLQRPEILPGGAMRVKVGLPDQRVRYVMAGDDPAMVKELANKLFDPATWLKVCAARELIAPLLPPRWTLSDPRYFMHHQCLVHSTLNTPAGYMLHLGDTGRILNAAVSMSDGTVVAKGRITTVGQHAIFDLIDTAPAHQRKGLGRLIMQSLANESMARGAKEGILVATEQGKMLYNTLGWQVVSSYTSACIL